MGRVPTRTSLQVVLICLALFRLVQSRAAVSSWPETTERMIRASRILSELDEVRQTNKEEELLEGRRMGIQMNDYAPSGPNDRHTPKPPE